MNIFFLDKDQNRCAKDHCDKHVVKMILEYTQMLCTAHRVLDGEEYYEKTKNDKNIKRYKLKNESLENSYYKSTHINHPCNIWVRQDMTHYRYLWNLLYSLCEEYSKRYKQQHNIFSSGLVSSLKTVPENIPLHVLLNNDGFFTNPPLCMPDYLKTDLDYNSVIQFSDVIECYRHFYIFEKSYMAKWYAKDNSRMLYIPPDWYIDNLWYTNPISFKISEIKNYKKFFPKLKSNKRIYLFLSKHICRIFINNANIIKENDELHFNNDIYKVSCIYGDKIYLLDSFNKTMDIKI